MPCNPTVRRIKRSRNVAVLYLLIPLSLIMAAGGLIACIWAIRKGQYDDTISPAQQIIQDETLAPRDANQ